MKVVVYSRKLFFHTTLYLRDINPKFHMHYSNSIHVTLFWLNVPKDAKNVQNCTINLYPTIRQLTLSAFYGFWGHKSIFHFIIQIILIIIKSKHIDISFLTVCSVRRKKKAHVTYFSPFYVSHEYSVNYSW